MPAPRAGAEVDVGRLSPEPYWSLPERAQRPFEGTLEEAAAELRRLLDDSVELRQRSDVPVGVNLSGGLDSASLMASVDALAEPGSRIETFTAAFDDGQYDESDFAAAVPHAAEWVRNVERVGPLQVWQSLDDVMKHQEAPFGGVATVGYHRLHELAARRGVTVLLEGQGVDELFGGYAYARPYRWLDLVREGREADARTEARRFGEDPDAAMAAARAVADEIAGGGGGMAVYQDGTRHLRPGSVARRLRERAADAPRFDRPFPDHLRNLLYRDLRYTKLPRVLRMNDRLSMASSRELREPFLDHRIVELAFRVPGDWKIGDGRSKRLLRVAMSDRLPDPVRLASKRAVVTPQREWIRGPLRTQVEALIQSERFRAGPFEPAVVEAEFSSFTQGKGDNSFFIWQWVSADLWARAFAELGPTLAGAGRPS